MKHLENYKEGYCKETINNMLKALLKEPQRSKLRKVQVDKLKDIEASTTYPNQHETIFIKTLYQNFVLNKFEFEDKTTKVVKTALPIEKHIGMTILEQANMKAVMLFNSDKRFKLTE